MDSENATKLDARGIMSFVLTAFTLLALGGVVLIFLNSSFNHSRNLDVFFWYSPLLSILTIIVAFNARKGGSAIQRKAATVCMIIGILGVVINGGYWLFFVLVWSFIAW